MKEITLPSVQSLFLEMRVNGHVLSSGTGFIVNSKKGPVLLTNRHNVTGRHQETGKPLSSTGGIPDELAIRHNVIEGLGRWWWKREPLYDAKESPKWIEHPILGEKADVVALLLTDCDGVELYPYDIDNGGVDLLIGPADAVSVIGFPFGITADGLPVWATGFIASEPSLDFDNLPIQLIDCRSRPGQSGSPVIAYRSGGTLSMSNGDTHMYNGPVFKLIGIYSGRINPESDLGKVWKLSAIRELVQSI